MLIETVRHYLFSLGYSTRCRNSDVAHVLKKFIKPDSTVLDVGCGENGVGSFINFAKVTGTDINLPINQNKDLPFVCSDITSLPFSEGTFSVAASVDVLEHLPTAIRVKALAELIRVARAGVVIAFPDGLDARHIDEHFRRKLAEFNKPEPEWLTEHLQNPYPQLESVLPLLEAKALEYHDKVSVKLFYSERIEITRILRWAGSQSKLLLISLDLLFGLLLPIIPQPTKDNHYRQIILISFQ